MEYALQRFDGFKNVNEYAIASQEWRNFILKNVKFRNKKNHLYEEFELTKKIQRYLQKLFGKNWKKLVFLPKHYTELFDSDGEKKRKPVLEPKKSSWFSRLKNRLFWR